jgi:hypothetical protein
MNRNSRFLVFIVFCVAFCLSNSAEAKQNHSLQLHQLKVSPADSTDYWSLIFKTGYSKEEIIKIPKGKRPLPASYIKYKYLRRHLRSFRKGAAFLVPKSVLDRFGRKMLGRTDGQFVMNKKEMDDLLLKASGRLSFIETELGIPSGYWQNTELIRIDIQRPRRLHIRIPSGNETGANELWIPGGKLPNGYSESVIDPIPQGKYTEKIILLK